MKTTGIREPELYRRLLTLDVDRGKAPRLRFVDRLAKENGWTEAFAAQVLHEYRRFLHLAAVGTTPVTPSKEVDACWHLHLTYTESYWKDLCGDVLGRPLHHTPTEGGDEEHHRYVAQYRRTLATYADTFGTPAPENVWPSEAETFGPSPRLIWKPKNYWVWRKPRALARIAGAFPLPLLLVAGCSHVNSPFELPGMKFLLFFAMAYSASLFGALIVRFFWEGPGGEISPGSEPPDLYSLAFLSGGPRAVTLTALAKMLEDGKLELAADGTTVTKKAGVDTSDDVVEAALIDAMPLTNDSTIRDAVTDKIDQALETRRIELERARLLQTERQHSLRPWITALPPLAVVLGLGVPRLVMGLNRGKPVLFLVLSMIAGLVGAVWLARTSTRGTPLTRRGVAWLHGRRKATPRFRDTKSTVAYDLPLAVALFGPAVATGAAYSALAPWLPPLPPDFKPGQPHGFFDSDPYGWYGSSYSSSSWSSWSSGCSSSSYGSSDSGGSSGCSSGGSSGCGGCGGGSSS